MYRTPIVSLCWLVKNGYRVLASVGPKKVQHLLLCPCVGKAEGKKSAGKRRRGHEVQGHRGGFRRDTA